MGREIVYCFKCQRRLLEQEFERGAAYQVGHHITCSDCARHLYDTLPPEEREQLLARIQEPQKPPPAGPPPPSSTRLRAQKDRRKTTGHIPILRPPATGTPSPAIAGVAIAGVVVFILIVVVVAGGSKPAAPAPARTPVAATPDDAPRRDAAQAALQQARQFARENPRDFPGQLRAWAEAVDAAERTPYFEEARRELGALTLRRKEAVAVELADLDTRVRGLVAAEDFKSAEVLLEEARRRREGPDWTPAVDAKIRHVRETAAKLFATLKAGAVDAPSRQALRDRILKWGLPEFSVGPEPVAERPWTSIIARGLDALRGKGYGGWRVENGALVKTEKDDAGQINEELGDGEIRVRFECVNAWRVRFTLRQGGAEEAFEASQDMQAMPPGPHEVVFLCKGDAVTATFDGQPFPVHAGKARKGLLQFNTAPPSSVLRILSLDYRPLPP